MVSYKNVFIAVEEWLLIILRPKLLTADFAEPLWHIAWASSSLMQPNTILTRNQLDMAMPGFELTIL